MLLLLQRLEMQSQIVQPDRAVVAVFLDLVEDGTPNRHLARAVRNKSLVACDNSAYAVLGK